MKYVVVFGASVVDIFGFSQKKYRAHNSTPGRVKMSFGGVCRNIAENLARVNVPTKFISVVGDDESGQAMMDHSKVYGYDMSDSLVLKDAGTPTYLAILNEMGEMVSAIADMSAIDQLTPEFIDQKDEIIRNSEYMFLDADSPENLEYIIKQYKDETKFILDPVSAEKAISIKHLIGHFHTIKPNRFEAEVMSGFEINSDEDLLLTGQYFLDLGVKNAFISLDEEGIFFMNQEEAYKVTAYDVNVENVTGAGDSFVAGLGYGFMNDFPILDTIKTAMAMSIIAIACDETINPALSIEYIDEVVKKTQWVVKKFK